MGSLQVEETSAYCTENHRASESNYQLSNMKRFEPAASEVGGENSNRYTTEPPINPVKERASIGKQEREIQNPQVSSISSKSGDKKKVICKQKNKNTFTVLEFQLNNLGN